MERTLETFNEHDDNVLLHTFIYNVLESRVNGGFFSKNKVELFVVNRNLMCFYYSDIMGLYNLLWRS